MTRRKANGVPNRIDHTGHRHPDTSHFRGRCRTSMLTTGQPLFMPNELPINRVFSGNRTLDAAIEEAAAVAQDRTYSVGDIAVSDGNSTNETYRIVVNYNGEKRYVADPPRRTADGFLRAARDPNRAGVWTAEQALAIAADIDPLYEPDVEGESGTVMSPPRMVAPVINPAEEEQVEVATPGSVMRAEGEIPDPIPEAAKHHKEEVPPEEEGGEPVTATDAINDEPPPVAPSVSDGNDERMERARQSRRASPPTGPGLRIDTWASLIDSLRGAEEWLKQNAELTDAILHLSAEGVEITATYDPGGWRVSAH